MIVIIDYGMGNLRSVLHKVKKIDENVIISSDLKEIAKATKLIIPGVGHFSKAMKNLKEMKLIPVLNNLVIKKKIPILGICLGIQLFTKHSEEGDVDGLGWIDAETKRFNFRGNSAKLKIPHIGWNTINIKKDTFLFNNMSKEMYYYFVHSYHVSCNNLEPILATTKYGYEFVSAIQKDNIYGTQFHPEKSHRIGMQIIKNFLENS